MPAHATATRPLQTLTLMPTNTRPKRKSAAAGLDDNSNGINGGGGMNGKEKDDAPVEPPKKKKKGKKVAEKEEDGGDKEEVKEKPPKKKQKRAKPDIHEDEGFIFRPRPRTRASLAATELVLPTAPPPPPAAVEPSKKKKSTALSRKRAHDSPPPIEESEFKTRKKISLVEAEEEDVKEKKPVKKAAAKTKTAMKAKASTAAAPVPISPPPRIQAGGGGSTKMALPVSDTPIIRRNQQMRKGGQGGGNRRSSVGLRGRRASSLMDTGVLAEPHPEIEHKEYYKHIHDQLLEPLRMKQLLAWCGRKALTTSDGKPESANAAAVARVIGDEILSDVLSNPGLSNWFSREQPKDKKDLKPNPRNIDNLAKIEAIEANLKKLLAEKATWKSLLKADTKAALSLAGGPDMNTLLQPSESAFASSSRSQDLLAEARGLVKQHTGEIEFQVDQLADGIHKLNHYGKAADRLAGRILEDAEATLAVREEKVRGEAGTGKLPMMEVLRSLARLER